MFYRKLLLISIISILTCTQSAGEYIAKYEGEEQFKEYFANRLDLVAQYITKNPIIFEAGGHYGDDTVRMAQKWPQGTIITFEPNPHAFEKLLQATEKLPNIRVHNLAANNYTGHAMLNICYGTTGDNPLFEGASSLLPASQSMEIHYQGPKVEIPCVILDNWCKQQKIKAIDFMWLDLEGLELQVLQSSPYILSTVQVIYTETNFFEFRQGMTHYQDLKLFLEKAGFKLIAHWYTEGLQGDALFVRQELFK
jgi:2-O-methyltransferase